MMQLEFLDKSAYSETKMKTKGLIAGALSCCRRMSGRCRTYPQ